jgi:hypothetical protein
VAARRISAVLALARKHRALTALLIIGLVVRIAVSVVYAPGLLFWGDSYHYLESAQQFEPPVRRVWGYSVFLRLLDLLGPLGLVPVVQHLLGLACGVVVYAVLERRSVPRWAAAAAAAPVLLDGYQINIEQFVLAESMFAALLLGALALLLARGPLTDIRAAGAGLFLAGAALTRSVALPLLVVFVLYLLVRRVGWKPLVAFVVATSTPLIAYAGWFAHEHDRVGFTAMSGRLLYGKTAPFVDCSAVPEQQRGLCPAGEPPRKLPPDFYSFGPGPGSPAAAYGYTAHDDGVLTDFARGVIVRQPRDYAASVLRDLGQYAGPVRSQRWSDQRISAWQFPDTPRSPFTVAIAERPGARFAGITEDPGRAASVLRAYQVVTMPGTALALCVLVSLLAAVRRGPESSRADGGRDRADCLLLASVGLLLVVVPAMTASLDYRFVLPTLVVLPMGAALGLRHLVGSARTGRPAPAVPAEPEPEPQPVG